MSDEKLLEYFIERTDASLSEIKRDVHELKAFKWKMMGAVMVVSALVSAGFQVALALAK